MESINNHLRKFFFKLGLRIGEKPAFFIVSSIFVSLFVGSGLVFLKYESDFEQVFVTKHGKTEKDMNKVDELFPAEANGSFEPSRRTRVGSYARLIIEAKDGGTLFRRVVWDEILQVNDLVHSASPHWNANYSSLCGKLDDECYENKFLDLDLVVDQIENGSLRVSYPVMFNPETFGSYVIPMNLGGVSLSNDSLSVESVRACNLYYFLSPGTDVDAGLEWEQELIDGIDFAKPHWKHIRVYYLNTQLKIIEQLKLLFTVLPYFAITIILMVLFLCFTAMSTDAVRSKPWAAFLGVICTTIGTMAGIGLLSFFGVPVILLVATVPFIMMGIGIDDTFVILAAWRQTNPLDDVPKRLAHCYAEAGVSITITTLTDMLSFYVGLMTPIEGIQIFSAYAGTCVLWIYLLQIFLLGGCLAIGGRQEAKNKHGTFWWMDAMPKSKSESKSKIYKLIFTGGIDRSDPTNKKNLSESGAMMWFKSTFSTYLNKFWVKAVVITLYLGYIAISCYGITKLEKGISGKRMYSPDSPVYHFYEKEELYFQDYNYRVQVLITSPLDYSNKTVQRQVSRMISQMNATGHIALEYSENWLEAYTRYLNAYKSLFEPNVTGSFINTLRGNFLNTSASRLRNDIKFNEDFTQIVASRFMLQSKNSSTTDLLNLVVDLREIAENQPFEVTVYNPYFQTTDMEIIIDSLTFQLLGTAAGIVMTVALLFIPNLMCSFLVFLMMITTELGVVGIMALWGVHLDMFSLMALVVCMGFAVDFTAHVSYAYVTNEGSPEDRIRKTMYALGFPIVQGGLSTILGVSAQFFFKAYFFKVMAKIITLVIGFAAFHGLLVLPVVLLIVRPERLSCGANLRSSKSKGSLKITSLSNPSCDSRKPV